MKTPPTEILEKQAAEQRALLHESVSELRNQVHQTLDPNRVARHYFRPFAATAGVFAFVIGYGIAGMFTDH